MLIDRKLKVLQAIVETYITKPTPVGSRFVTKRFDFNLSPATIRNIMADLEELGFLVQPHTSAGRVPTDKGYRFYVDSISEDNQKDIRRMSDLMANRIKAVHDGAHDLLEEVTHTCADATRCMVFAVPMQMDNTTLNRIQLYRYRDTKAVAVLLTNEGIVKHRIVETNSGLTQKELTRLSDYLNSQFAGATMDDIRAALARQMVGERAICDILITKVMAICSDALTFPTDEMVVSGVSELLRLPELSDRINRIVRAIEEKHRMIQLLEHMEMPSGVAVLIGTENPVEVMQDLSIVAARYSYEGKAIGTVGLIGPRWMDYQEAIAAARAMADFVSQSITK